MGANHGSQHPAGQWFVVSEGRDFAVHIRVLQDWVKEG